MSMNELKLNSIKLNSPLSETNDSRENVPFSFLLSFLVSNLILQNLLGSLEVILWARFHLLLTTICDLHVLPHPASAVYFVFTLIWIVTKSLANGFVSTCLDYSKSFCQVLRTLTSPNSNVSRIDWPVLGQSHLHLIVVFICCCIPFICYQ